MNRMTGGMVTVFVVACVFMLASLTSAAFADEQQEYEAADQETGYNATQTDDEILPTEQAEEAYTADTDEAEIQEPEVREVEEEPYDYDREMRKILSDQGIDVEDPPSNE